MATISVILDKRYKHKDDTFSIAIRITNKNKTRYKPVGFAVKDNQFRDSLSNWVTRHPDAVYINALIEDQRSNIVAKLTKLQLEKRPFDFNYLLSDIPANGHTIGEILTHISEVKDSEDEVSQANRHLSLKRQVIACLGADMCLNDVGMEHVQKIVAYFRSGDPENGYIPNRPNTVNRKLRYLSDAYTAATKMWPKEIQPNNPFKLVKVKREKGRKIKLTWAQVQAMETMQLDGMMDLSRDMYLYAFYAQGMRFENVLTMKREALANLSIDYRMNKGRDLRSIEVHPKLKRIIDKYRNSGGPYLFPLLKKECKTKRELYYAKDEANYNVNFYLKRIGQLLGLTQPLTFHTSRHTYAHLAKKSGVDPWVIKDSLGHTTFATTEEYLNSLDDDDINSAVTPVYYK